MGDKTSYGLKDLITDAAILSIFGGILLLTIGSFPEFFGRFLPFFE